MKPICSFPGCAAPIWRLGLCGGHHTQYQRGVALKTILRGAPARFWAKVQKTETCWLWTGRQNASGYGTFGVAGRSTLVHRWAYEQFVGPIPDGLTIDHLCRNTVCVNPDHLEPVTNRENILRGGNRAAENARKTHCIHGHEFTPENTYLNVAAGKRNCRMCVRAAKRRWLIAHGIPELNPDPEGLT